ncbi:MAG: hypothetical protein ABII06_05140, partial [Pseudomonadota bacterium]
LNSGFWTRMRMNRKSGGVVMGWKFWESDKGSTGPSKSEGQKLRGPRELPDTVGRHLVVKLHKDPDWVWGLKAVVRNQKDSKTQYDIRIFDERMARERQVKVKDYTTLDACPDVILFEGWYDKKTQKVQIDEKTPLDPAIKVSE